MHMHFFPLYLHICESLWIKCDQPRSNSHPCLPPHLSSCNLSLSPIHLPLTQPLCPCHFSPSFNDLAITGAAVPALVSQGVRGLIGTEWVWVCVIVRPHWHRLGSRGCPRPHRDVLGASLHTQSPTQNACLQQNRAVFNSYTFTLEWI